MAVLTQKLKASSLVEVLVASVIITTVFAIGTMIYLNVIEGVGGTSRMRANILAESTIVTTISSGQFVDQEWEEDNYQVQQLVKNYQGQEDLFELQVTVYNRQGKLLALEKRVVYVEAL